MIKKTYYWWLRKFFWFWWRIDLSGLCLCITLFISHLPLNPIMPEVLIIIIIIIQNLKNLIIWSFITNQWIIDRVFLLVIIKKEKTFVHLDGH